MLKLIRLAAFVLGLGLIVVAVVVSGTPASLEAIDSRAAGHRHQPRLKRFRQSLKRLEYPQ